MAITLDSFMDALGQKESTNNYQARNKSSGAYGKYQIMPQYWSAWAQQAGLSPNAPKTPKNQEKVARNRVRKLYEKYGNWADVASVWYSGRPYSKVNANAAQSSGPSIKNYVNSVLQAANKGGRGMSLPVSKGRITQVYGRTNEPLDSGGFNKGLDIGVPVGTAVRSVTGGRVVKAGWGEDGWGVSVKVVDDEGNTHNYGHLSGTDVKVGDRVKSGQVIARSGNSGASTGPHLSYDVKGTYGHYVDPSPWLGFNAAGDNRKGHPMIGKDISEVGRVDPSLEFGESSDAPFNARALTGGGGYYSGQTIPVGNDGERFDEGGEIAADYEPTGDFNQDASAYWNLSTYFRNEVNKIRNGYGGTLLIDEDTGVVYDPGADLDNLPPELTDVNGTAIHQQATEAYNRAIGYEQNLDRLFAARQAGLIDNGQDAAAAYLASEQEKAAEATRQYEDYVRRISDLADIESIPQQRQQTLAATIQAVNKANQERGRFDSGMLAEGGPEFTDTQPFADAIKKTIPEQAPEPYNIDPAALEPQPTGGLTGRLPEDILNDYNNRYAAGSQGGGAPGVDNAPRYGSRETGGVGAINRSTPPSAGGGGGGGGGGSWGADSGGMSLGEFLQYATGIDFGAISDLAGAASKVNPFGGSGMPESWNPRANRFRRDSIGPRPQLGR